MDHVTDSDKGRARRGSLAVRGTLVFGAGAWALLGLTVLVATALPVGVGRNLVIALAILSLLSAALAVLCFVWTVSRGLHSWPNSAGFVLAVLWWLLAIAAAVLPTLTCRHQSAYRTKCMSNIKQIGYACQLYAGDNADAFPPDLRTLFPDYVSDSDVYVCPTVAREGHLTADTGSGGTFVPEAVCYCYVTGLRATDDEDSVVAFDEEWNHAREGVCVLTVGGTVEWTRDIDEFHASLEKQHAALAAAGRAMEIIRPPWSRWPDPPEYFFVRPWHERTWTIALCAVAALAAAVGVAALIITHRRAIKAASAEG